MNHCKRKRPDVCIGFKNTELSALALTLFWSAVAGFLMGGGVLLIAAVLR